MKKIITKLLVALSVCLPVIKAQAQLSQFCIGTSRNEVATNIIHLADGSTVLGGYQYDISGGDINNAKMVLLKVSATGTIVWQKTWGEDGSNNLMQDMIATKDGNIVVVGTIGRSFIYGGNKAFIMKVDDSTGNKIFQKIVHNTTPTTGGEIFLGVAEVPGVGTVPPKLIAVGASDFTTNSSEAMICTFNGNTGSLLYNEEYYYDYSGGQYQDVVAAPDNKSVYICGQYSDNYGDGIVLKYVPGTLSGIKIWERHFDFTQNGYLQDNFFTKIHTSGKKLSVEGGSLYDYSETNGSGQFILTMDTSGSTTLPVSIKAIKNKNAYFTNCPSVAFVDSDHMFTAQSPALNYYDPVIWATGATTSAVVTEITSLSAETANIPVKLEFPSSPGLHSILSMQYAAPNLYMAGSTNATGFGANDMYCVISSPSFASTNETCDTLQDSVYITDPSPVDMPATITAYTFTPAYDSLTLSNADMQIELVCGDNPATPCFNGDRTTLSVSQKNCVFTATVHVSTAKWVLGYEWTIPGMGTLVVHTHALSNTQTFTLPPGVSGDACVTIFAVDTSFVIGESPCCDTTLCQKVYCLPAREEQFDGDNNINNSGSISIYPNPANENVNIESSEKLIKNIQVIDVNSKIINEYNYNGQSVVTISLHNYIPGNYLIRINRDISKIITKLAK